MTTDNSADVLAPSQAAREAAADVWRDLIARPGECIAEKQIRVGGAMDRMPLTQAFARFERDIRTESADDALLREALEEFCQAAEYWAGCDEGCTAEQASSEIMRCGGCWPAQAYDKARAVLAHLSRPRPARDEALEEAAQIVLAMIEREQAQGDEESCIEWIDAWEMAFNNIRALKQGNRT